MFKEQMKFDYTKFQISIYIYNTVLAADIF